MKSPPSRLCNLLITIIIISTMEKSTHNHDLTEKVTLAIIVAGVIGYWAYILLGNGLG